MQRGESARPSEVEVAASRTWPHPFAHVQADAQEITTLLLPGIGDGVRGVARLVEIRRRTAKLVDAGVLPLLSVEVERGTGRVLLRTPAFDGITLAELLARERPDPTRVTGIFAALTRVIATAHREGLLHRALGPASVLVGARDDVRVLDFGIGELLDKASPSTSLRLQPFTPERVLGLPRGVAEDVYLLGCMGYFLATGEPALVDDDVEHLRRRHAIEDPPRLARVGSPVPARLARAIDRCLAKDAEDRFADVDELLVEIDAVAAELRASLRKPIAPPVLAPALGSVAPPVVAKELDLELVFELPELPPTPAAPVPAPVVAVHGPVTSSIVAAPPNPSVAVQAVDAAPTLARPGRRPVAIALGVAALVVSIVALARWSRDASDTTAPTAAPAGLVSASTPASDAVARAPEAPRAPTHADEPQAPAIAAATPVLEPPADEDEPVLVAPAVVAPEVSELLASATLARKQGRRADAMKAYQEVATIDPDNAEALGALARISFDRADFRDAVQWGKRAVAASPRNAKARIALGDAYFKLGKRSEAEAQYRRASALGHDLAERRLAMLAKP